MPPSSDPQAFRDTLATAKRVVILAGAGLSAASGIPTYRGPDGLWKTQDPKQFATPEAFTADPSAVWQFYHARHEQSLQAQPNAAHRALAALALPAVRARVAPALAEDAPPLLVTQNIDGLSLRALDALPPAVQPRARARLIEMHGSVHRTRCLQCAHVGATPPPPPPHGEDGGADGAPRCGGAAGGAANRYGRCGGRLRPAVVWFGEVPEGLGEIARELNWTDLLLVVGTSSLVRPAAGFARTVQARGGRVAVFNLGRSEGDDGADFVFWGPCEETLPVVLGIGA